MEFKTHIVPWALPNEDIPLRVCWDKILDFDEIIIETPQDMVINEIINIGEGTIHGNVANIYSVKQIEESENYFGCVVSSTIINNELKIERTIKIKIRKGEQILKKLQIKARIFRPKIEIVKSPDVIKFEPGKKQELPLIFKYIGFGDIQIEILGRIGGKLVTKGKSFLYEILNRLVETGLVNEKKGNHIEISPEFIRKTTHDILEILENPPDDVDDIVRELNISLKDDMMKSKFEEILHERIQDLVLSMLADSIQKNPVNNIKLAESETSVEAVLTSSIETLELFVQYRDVIDNEYPTIHIPIKIEVDIKPGEKSAINIPISFERWESEPYLNVKEMEI